MEKFGIVKLDVMQDPDLSLRAKGLYGVMATFANKDRICYPSINHLAELCGTDRKTISRALSELQTKDYVKREKRAFKIR